MTRHTAKVAANGAIPEFARVTGNPCRCKVVQYAVVRSTWTAVADAKRLGFQRPCSRVFALDMTHQDSRPKNGGNCDEKSADIQHGRSDGFSSHVVTGVWLCSRRRKVGKHTAKQLQC